LGPSEGGGTAEQAADIIGVVHALEDQHTRQRTRRDAIERWRRRAPDERQAAAMNIEAGDLVHHLLRGDVDRRGGFRQHVAQGSRGRLCEQDRVDRPVTDVDQPPHDESALGDEQAEVDQLIGTGDVTIRGEA